MNNITTENFYGHFLEIVKELKLAEYKDCFHLTTFLKKKINEYITERGYRFTNEYYRIDTIAWEKIIPDDMTIKEGKDHNLSLYLWELKAAFEYENNKYEWLDELVKLSYIKCPLKVIITYNYCDKRKDEKLGDTAKIEFGKSLLKQIGTLDSREEYLIIIGNACAKESKIEYTDFGYRGYVLKGDTITPLQ